MALLLIKLALEVFHASPGHSQASGCTEVGNIFAELVEY